MEKVFQTIWHLLMLGVSLAYFGVLGATTVYLGKSALSLHKQGLISLTELTHSLEGRNYYHHEQRPGRKTAGH